MVPPKGGTILCGLPKGVFDFAAKLCCWLLEKPAYQNLNFDDINIIFKQCHPRPGVERDEIREAAVLCAIVLGYSLRAGDGAVRVRQRAEQPAAVQAEVPLSDVNSLRAEGCAMLARGLCRRPAQLGLRGLAERVALLDPLPVQQATARGRT